MADNDEKTTAPKPAAFTRPATTRSTSALGEPKLPVKVAKPLDIPISDREELSDATAYDVKLRELSAQDIERMERQVSSPTPAYFRVPIEASPSSKEAPSIDYPPIHYSNYQKTSQSDFDVLKSNMITSDNLTKSHEIFRNAESIFSMNNVLTIMNGARQQPEPTSDNPTGYRQSYLVTLKGVEYKISSDDAGKYDHDYMRCFPMIFYLCHRSIYYLAQAGFLNQDPIVIYTALKEHFNGHAGKDMIRINRLINDFKSDNNATIQKDLIRLDNLYRELEYTMGKPMHEELKLAQLMSLFQFDKRPGVEACMAQISFCTYSYGPALHAIMALANAIDSNTTRHQMKSLM